MFARSMAAIATLLITVGGTVTLTDAIVLADSAQIPLRLTQSQRRPARADWLRELNLSQEQVQKIQEIRNRYEGRLTEQRQAVRQAQQELKQLMAGNASAEQLRPKFDQLQALKQKLSDTRMESMLAIREVLTSEQRQQLSQIIKQRGGKRDRMESPF
ncbi:hypothetical protein OsccyDRAFT_1600 [Leptolyngbyaceae cyanobacterium JSC-12]|nr:hypothetical protein OsccyDRAFT_1600 [Leptolyngbyaceae cyanobacterium JSC-12]